jgi:uncharacterized protein (TIGR01777 family)
MRVFVTGGTGLVGRRLVAALTVRGDEAIVLSRRLGAARAVLGEATAVVEGDPMTPGPWAEAVAGSDAVVNLAGENIFARRWNESFRKRLVDSRVQTTRNVVAATRGGQPRVLVSASAIGYYGSRGDEELDESSPPGDDFMARLCVEWEKAAADAPVRTARVRIGVVLDRAGGALPRMAMPFKLFAGGPVAGGRQWLSWVHYADLTGLLLFALDSAGASGPLNGTAPGPVTNRDFSRALGRALHRPAFFPTPGFGLRLGLGGVAEVVVGGQRVLPRRPLQLGYAFRYPEIGAALAELYAG